MPLHHVVMFKLAGGDGGASATAIDPLIRTLAQTAPGALTCETAVDAGVRPGHPRSYHRLVHFTFADVQEAYDTFKNAGSKRALKVIVTSP